MEVVVQMSGWEVLRSRVKKLAGAPQVSGQAVKCAGVVTSGDVVSRKSHVETDSVFISETGVVNRSCFLVSHLRFFVLATASFSVSWSVSGV